MRRLIGLFALCLSLIACSAAEPTPAYLVRLSGNNASCTGYAVDAHHVVTANHCTDDGLNMVRAGFDAPIAAEVVAQWPEIDTAIFETAESMNLTEYALLSVANPSQPAYLFGGCPRWHSDAGRFVEYDSPWSGTAYCGGWKVSMAYACSGDSGGPIEQGFGVVGMLVQVSDWGVTGDMLLGNKICVVPADEIQSRLIAWRQER